MTDPHFIEPMPCLAVKKLPEGDAWQYELKLDGYRALAAKHKGQVTPDLATFRETTKTRTMTYCNSEGGTYRVRVVLHRASGRLETFKYKGKKLIAPASGMSFDSAMVRTTLVGIEKDEMVRVIRC
jgi:hypothetical protein